MRNRRLHNRFLCALRAIGSHFRYSWLCNFRLPYKMYSRDLVAVVRVKGALAQVALLYNFAAAPRCMALMRRLALVTSTQHAPVRSRGSRMGDG